MEGLVLIVIALIGIAVFLGGGLLLVLYFRYIGGGDREEPVVYGDLIQCPNCGYMNPLETAACLNCRYPLPGAVPYQEPLPPPYAPPVQASYAPPAPAPPPPSQASYSPPVGDYTIQSQPAGATRAQVPPRPIGQSDDVPHAWLEGARGPLTGQQTVLSRNDTLVGRSTICDIQIADPKVSRRHFLIRYANGSFFVQDQQSSRGTRVNGKPVLAQRLNNGDTIEFGDSMLIFRQR